jgi:DNA polymerase III epsilon subunit-like protein
MRRRVVVDLETTGLTAGYHDIWEIGVIELTPAGRVEHRWLIEPDLKCADRDSLDIGHFFERTAGVQPGIAAVDLAQAPGPDMWSEPSAISDVLCHLLRDVTLICAGPTFDANFLDKFMLRHGCRQRWHYRTRDIGSIVYGYLNACMALGVPGRDAALGVPAIDASVDDFARALGLNPDGYDRHTALGDCRLVADMLDIVEGSAAAS